MTATLDHATSAAVPQTTETLPLHTFVLLVRGVSQATGRGLVVPGMYYRELGRHMGFLVVRYAESRREAVASAEEELIAALGGRGWALLCACGLPLATLDDELLCGDCGNGLPETKIASSRHRVRSAHRRGSSEEALTLARGHTGMRQLQAEFFATRVGSTPG